MTNENDSKKIEYLGQELARISVKIEIVCKNISESARDIKEINKNIAKILETLNEHERRINLLEKNQRWVAIGLISGLGFIFLKLFERFI